METTTLQRPVHFMEYPLFRGLESQDLNLTSKFMGEFYVAQSLKIGSRRKPSYLTTFCTQDINIFYQIQLSCFQKLPPVISFGTELFRKFLAANTGLSRLRDTELNRSNWSNG